MFLWVGGSSMGELFDWYSVREIKTVSLHMFSLHCTLLLTVHTNTLTFSVFSIMHCQISPLYVWTVSFLTFSSVHQFLQHYFSFFFVFLLLFFLFSADIKTWLKSKCVQHSKIIHCFNLKASLFFFPSPLCGCKPVSSVRAPALGS